MTFVSNDVIKMQCVYDIVITIMSNDVIVNVVNCNRRNVL